MARVPLFFLAVCELQFNEDERLFRERQCQDPESEPEQAAYAATDSSAA